MNVNGIVKLADLFKKAADRTDYMRQYMKDRYHARRNQLIDELGRKCNNCGSLDGPWHVDHIDKKKKTMRASDIHSTSDKKVKKEKKNLQLLCSKCHIEKTKDSWDYAVPKTEHGTYWMYKKYNCRCDDCIEAFKKKKKEWRDK